MGLRCSQTAASWSRVPRTWVAGPMTSRSPGSRLKAFSTRATDSEPALRGSTSPVCPVQTRTVRTSAKPWRCSRTAGSWLPEQTPHGATTISPWRACYPRRERSIPRLGRVPAERWPTSDQTRERDHFGFATALPPDGRILVGGLTILGGAHDFALVRLTPEGALDTSYGLGTGGSRIDFGGLPGATKSADIGYALAIQPDGRILMAGTSDALGTPSFAVTRVLSPQGTFDTSFAAGAGRAVIGFGADAEAAPWHSSPMARSCSSDRSAATSVWPGCTRTDYSTQRLAQAARRGSTLEATKSCWR